MSNLDGKDFLSNLISSLPLSRIEYIKNEFYGSLGIKKFLEDIELIKTIKNFLKNDLNTLKTSKQTFMHRNTLLYRIQKVKKLTGLDVRHFEDALTIEIILKIDETYKKMM